SFATLGAGFEAGALISALLLVSRLRDRDAPFGCALLGAGLLGLAQLLWWVLVAPVNAQMADWTPTQYPADWEPWRSQWEYTQAVRAALQWSALAALGWSSLPGAAIELPVAVGVHKYAAFRSGARPRSSGRAG